MHQRARLVLSLLAATTLFATAKAASAQSLLIELSRHSFDIDGDFDDSILLTGPDYALNVPALQQANGLGIAIGMDLVSGYFLFNHVRANPKASSVLGDATARFRSLGMDLAFAPRLRATGISFSPLFRMGGCFTWIRIPDAASDGVTLETAGFNGIQFNLGVGAIVRFSRRFYVSADFSRRFLNFTAGNAYDETLPIDDGLSGTTNAFTVAVGAYLGRR